MTKEGIKSLLEHYPGCTSAYFIVDDPEKKGKMLICTPDVAIEYLYPNTPTKKEIEDILDKHLMSLSWLRMDEKDKKDAIEELIDLFKFKNQK